MYSVRVKLWGEYHTCMYYVPPLQSRFAYSDKRNKLQGIIFESVAGRIE